MKGNLTSEEDEEGRSDRCRWSSDCD